jgi:hypothetical protein
MKKTTTWVMAIFAMSLMVVTSSASASALVSESAIRPHERVKPLDVIVNADYAQYGKKVPVSIIVRPAVNVSCRLSLGSNHGGGSTMPSTIKMVRGVGRAKVATFWNSTYGVEQLGLTAYCESKLYKGAGYTLLIGYP